MSSVSRQKIARSRRLIEHETLEHAALADLLSRRRAGRSISCATMDDSLARMLACKRQAILVKPSVLR